MKKILQRITQQFKELTGKITVKIWVIAGITIIALGYLVPVSLAPVKTLKHLNHFALADSVFTEQYKIINKSPELALLAKEKGFKEAQLSMAKSDSIGLKINFKDSTLSLVIKGVTIHAAEIKNYKIDKVFFAIENLTSAKLFSSPLNIQHESATIVKEPIIVKHAPKDAAEAAQQAYMPDTLQKNPAFLSMVCTYNIQLIVKQVEKESFKDKKIGIRFDFKNYVQKTANTIWSILRLQIPEYKPVIQLYVSGDDIRTIYRALPRNAMVVIYY
ncbi:MAG: hypothetical protein JXJ22_15730 [Bacteroidales bacterium]|nr:hypothetical protein [Bacteroidales bacterium]